MSFKSLPPSRASAPQRPSDADAGYIVILMMALVFVPIILAHAAMMWQGQFGGQQLAAIVGVLLKPF